ncbi:MAG: DUF4190 domain-containing protein [Acidimicrobiales bacterium]|nr:DUF4190 domain-containing protein [Acidimicrobiales bacterium]
METTTSPEPIRPANGRRYGVTALVLGVVALASALGGFLVVTIPVAFATGILAIVFGTKELRDIRAGAEGSPGMAKGGVATGAAGLGLLAVGAIALAILGATGDWERWEEEWEREHEERLVEDGFDECIDDADEPAEVSLCIRTFPDDAARAGLRAE